MNGAVCRETRRVLIVKNAKVAVLTGNRLHVSKIEYFWSYQHEYKYRYRSRVA